MDTKFSSALEVRVPRYPIDPLFLERWSPRALKQKPVDKQELMRIFEAARWAPSSFNHQPWRFIYAMRGSPSWDQFFSLLTEGNKASRFLISETRANFCQKVEL